MRWILASVALLLASASELAAQGKGIRFWNLTSETLTEVSLAPAGTMIAFLVSWARIWPPLASLTARSR